jgi:hypothetical protein
MRYNIGQFLTDRRGSLWCIVLAFRMAGEPSEWVYTLEARKNLSNPATTLSALCERVTGGAIGDRIIWTPITGRYDPAYEQATANDYMHGDHVSVSNKRLIRDYTVVASGEINTAAITNQTYKTIAEYGIARQIGE